MNRIIKKVAILGSGVMGSRIACHFANIGVEVLLLDIAPKELNEVEKAKGLTIDNPLVRNRIVNNDLQATIKSKPAPLYDKKFAARIKTGNFDDDLNKIADADWVIEVVIENLDIKKSVFEKVEQYRKKGTLITSNTSGIPIELMLDGRSDDFKKHFCGTHFFNPPRYLPLLEIIPSTKTDKKVIDFLMHYGDLFLGKTTVLCKDTPAFIANRIGVYSIAAIFHLMGELDLSVEEIDKLSGPIIGRAKSATFRTCDVVGIDTLVKVTDNLYDACPNDEAKNLFQVPDYVKKLVEKDWLGDKSGQGFYKKDKVKGKSVISFLDVKSFEYKEKGKPKFKTLDHLKKFDDLKERIKNAVEGKDKAGEFYQKFLYGICAYVSNRIPEITDEVYKIDDALKAGFGWELGPFETWDIFGIKESISKIEATGNKVADWVKDMAKNGHTSFYKSENGARQYYDFISKEYKNIPGTDTLIYLDNYRAKNVIWKNDGVSLFDLGDGILNLEFQSKMNTMGKEVLEGIAHSIDIAEKDYEGLVIGNEGANFTVGANLGAVFMLAIEQDYKQLNHAISLFQNTMMRVRYSSIPVVVAPHTLTLGGGCELTLHADAVQAAAETYIGMVELGVGVIPGGGGTKEFALRASDEYYPGSPEIPTLQNRLMTIAQAKVATSAHEAYDLGILKKGRDGISVNKSRLISDAKIKALELAEGGYTQGQPRKDVKVLGKTALGLFYTGASSMRRSGYISEHDELISKKLAFVICGGDLSTPQMVSEQYLLDLEREAFLSLLGEKKTLERIEYMLNKGKPLRN